MRQDPPAIGSELEQLSAFLDYQRETVLGKAEDLDAEQFRRTLPPSSLTIGGLLNHLALVEDSWFRERFSGLPEGELWAGVDWESDPDFEFRTAAELDPDVLRQRYRDACARSREIVAQAEDLDQVSVGEWPDGTHWNLRWVLIHMIEETARHAGHADLLRESIDGSVGE
ncbi:MAG: hypothetical protein JWO98_1429 [Frankiales bacterium]|nr:hypothetical protein [Frankiales bacterium]